MKPFEYINHTADMGIVSYGKSLEAVFENAALGMFEFLADLKKVTPKEELNVYVEGEDRETLLVEWLNELLYLHETRRMLFSKFKVVELTETHLKAEVFGEKIQKRHQLENYIKACTYHELKIEAVEGGYRAQVICDV
jgi:SHS2 domain-containing protein